MLKNPHVFPCPLPRERGESMRDIKRQWKRIREDASIELWTAANLDRTKELYANTDDAEERRTLVLDEMRSTGAKPFDIRLHDLRGTVGSWLAMSGASLQLVGKVLNHADPSTTAIYARLQKEAERDVLEQHVARILATATAAMV